MIENVCQLYSHQEREIGIEFQFEIPLKTTFYIVLLELKKIACMTHPPLLSIFSGKFYIKKRFPSRAEFHIQQKISLKSD